MLMAENKVGRPPKSGVRLTGRAERPTFEAGAAASEVVFGISIGRSCPRCHVSIMPDHEL
jgi:hypothetical protein